MVGLEVAHPLVLDSLVVLVEAADIVSLAAQHQRLHQDKVMLVELEERRRIMVVAVVAVVAQVPRAGQVQQMEELEAQVYLLPFPVLRHLMLVVAVVVLRLN